MHKKAKLEGVGLLDSFLSLADRFKYLFVLFGIPLVSTWSAALTKSMEYFAPFSYVMAAFIGLLIGAVILALFGLFKERVAKAKYQEAINSKPHTINILDDTFTNKVIDIRDFTDAPDLVYEIRLSLIV